MFQRGCESQEVKFYTWMKKTIIDSNSNFFTDPAFSISLNILKRGFAYELCHLLPPKIASSLAYLAGHEKCSKELWPGYYRRSSNSWECGCKAKKFDANPEFEYRMHMNTLKTAMGGSSRI
jgi:hypothetical protein